MEVTIQIILTHKQTAGRAMGERKTCRMNEKHTTNRSMNYDKLKMLKKYNQEPFMMYNLLNSVALASFENRSYKYCLEVGVCTVFFKKLILLLKNALINQK